MVTPVFHFRRELFIRPAAEASASSEFSLPHEVRLQLLAMSDLMQRPPACLYCSVVTTSACVARVNC